MSFPLNKGLFSRKIVDHFAVLGLPIDADPKAIRKAYLKIAQQLHPDTCVAEDPKDQQLASSLLSKLVNPAYAKLSSSVTKSEYQLLLTQLSQQLSEEAGDLGVTSERAKALWTVLGDDLSAHYRTQLEALHPIIYSQLGNALNIIAECSELNLVYLHCLGNKPSEGAMKPNKRPTDANASGRVFSEQTPSQISRATRATPFQAAMVRGQMHLDSGNPAKALLEFKDALKLDPESLKAHALLGMAYLAQNQFSMAKIHIKKANSAKIVDETAHQAKLAFEKATGSSLEQGGKFKKEVDGRLGGFFGSIFGGKKK